MNEVRDVSLRELLRLTRHFADGDTFRWFSEPEVRGDTLRVSFGEVRRAIDFPSSVSSP